MTPDLFSIPVVFDTSVLHAAGVSSAPFQVLKGLGQAGLVRVLLPELAVDEFRTQWRDKNQSNVGQSVKALKALSSEALLPAQVASAAGSLSSQLLTLDLEDLSNDFVKKYMNDNGFEVLPLSFDQAKEAWKSYFFGNLPSKKAKYRPDIPDAHIVAALKELAVKENSVLFISLDKGQREAASEVSGVICFDSLDTLLKSSQLQHFIAKWQVDQKWKAVQATLPFGEITQRVREFVQTEGGELLSWEKVTDPSIPEDNHTASVTMYGEPDDLEIEGPEDWGGGLLRYKATYFSECLLSFQVFRSDAFDVPEWISVSIGDFEKDHYFEAEGYAAVVAKVDVTVRINLDENVQGIDDRIEDISFEGRSLELELGSYE